MKMRRAVMIAGLALTFSVPVGQTLWADDMGSMGSMKMMPQTAEEHTSMADSYKKKAAEYRQDADYHRKMLEDYSKTVATTPKTKDSNPWIAKMKKHCGQYIQDAEKLAADADQMAQFHSMRAKEVQGQ